MAQRDVVNVWDDSEEEDSGEEPAPPPLQRHCGRCKARGALQPSPADMPGALWCGACMGAWHHWYDMSARDFARA